MKYSGFVLSIAATAFPLTSGTLMASDWLQFGFDPSHSGNNPAETTINTSNASTLVQIYSVALPTGTAAAPVYLSGVPTSHGVKDMLFVMSYDGTLLAIDASNGVGVWSRQPPAVPYLYGYASEAASPVIDPNRQFVYGYGLDGYIHKYKVGDGVEIVSALWPVVSSLKPDIEHGAAALAIGTPPGGPNYLYAVMNGFNGDNGDYQGHVTTINLDTGSSNVFNANCSNLSMHFVENGTFGVNDCAAPRSGIWGRPGAVYDGATNRMYITTANGNFNANVGGFNWGDSVLALHPNGLGDAAGNPLDSYTPTEFYDLDFYDIDLGSGSLAILPAPGGSNVAHLGVIMGKDSIVRLLNLDDMSGNHGPRFVGGELQELNDRSVIDAATPQPTVWTNSTADESTWLFVPQFGSLVAFQLTVDGTGAPALQQRWISHASAYSTSSIISNGVLYAASNQVLQAMDPVSGSILWTAPSSLYCCGWGSPIVVNGRLYVVSDTVTAFALDSVFKNGFD
jgi:hypothetical protein